MGYFDFVAPDLSPDDEMDTLRKEQSSLKQYNANPPKWTADQLGEDSFKPPASAEENALVPQKSYTQRRAETSAKVFDTANKIIDKYEKALPRQLTEEAEKTRNEIRANPDNAAKSLEKFFTKVKPYITIDETTNSTGVQDPWDHRYTPMGPLKDKWATPSLDFYDKDFLDLENHVRGIRSMKRGPEEAALSGQLAQIDLQKNSAELKNLQDQLDKVTQEINANNLPEAVSARSEEENKNAMAAKQAQAAALAQHIDELQQQNASLTKTATPKSAPTEVGNEYYDEQGNPKVVASLDLKGDIDSNIKAAGRNPRDFRLAMVAAAKTLEEKTGLDTMALKDRVPFQRALLSALQIFDPAGIIVSQLAQDMQPSAPPSSSSQEVSNQDQKSGTQTTGAKGASAQPEVSPEEDLHTQNIRKMQADRRQLYNELGQTPELQSWLGVLTFVFLSVITRSPAVAASILGISRRQGNLKMQLDLIEKEMHEEGGMLRDAQKRTEFTRKLAAEHSLRRQDKAEDFQLELQKMYLQHKLILQREAARNPENKNAYKQLENAFVRQKSFYDKAQHKKDEAQRILSNDFSDEALKAKAQKDFDAAAKEMKFYESRLRDLDLEIRRQGGNIQFQDEVPQEANP